MKQFITKLTKPILGFLAAVALFATPVNAQTLKTISANVSATTPLTVLTGSYVITDFLFVNSTNVAGTVKFYDSASNGTNYVQGAYTSYSTVSTNWSNVFTNATGIVITNTFTGIANVGTVHEESTYELPARLSFIVTGSGSRAIERVFQPVRGATIYSTVPGVIELTYRPIP